MYNKVEHLLSGVVNPWLVNRMRLLASQNSTFIFQNQNSTFIFQKENKRTTSTSKADFCLGWHKDSRLTVHMYYGVSFWRNGVLQIWWRNFWCKPYQIFMQAAFGPCATGSPPHL